MKKYIFTVAIVFVSSLVMGQTDSENYVETTAYQVKTLNGTHKTNGQELMDDDKIESITYYDGLGRPKQSVSKQAGGQDQDIIIPILYDGFGRQSKQYLPYANTNQPEGSGNLNFIDQETLLNSINSKYYQKFPEEGWDNLNDVNAYSETIFELNRQDRILEQGAPGKNWKNSNEIYNGEHTIKYIYDCNSDNEVPIYSVIFPTGSTEIPSLRYDSYYELNQLYKTITKDENWQETQISTNDHTTEEFKDKQGRVILKRTYNNGSPHDTQYVYDDYGNLTYVLSPKGSDVILSQQGLTSFAYDILTGRNGATITPDKARRGTGIITTGQVMVSSFSTGDNRSLSIDFDVTFSEETPLKTGAIVGLKYYVPDVVLGTIQATGGEYIIGVKDQTLYFSGAGTFTAIDESLTVELPSHSISATAMEDLCYQYHYDSRNRLIEKKIPGKGWESIVYDKLDRPVLTQDALLDAEGKWLFTKYDAFGRVAYTGLTNSNYTRTSMQSAVNSQNTLFETSGTVNIDNIDTYYTNNAYPQNIAELHTINYYDNYNPVLTLVAAKPPMVFGQNTTWQVKSLPTGSRVRILTDTGNHWITSVSYYDDMARPIYAASNNSYLNTTDIVETELDFTGKVLQTKSYHTKGATTIQVDDTFSYDHANRLLSQQQQINGQATETIVNNTYDELGQLVRKAVGASLQNIDYSYNIRGWLKGINDVNSLNNDLFSFQLNYTNNSSYQSDPLYNGNIADALWKTANDNELYSYNYRYDALNRITDAVFNGGGMGDRYNLAGVGYDKNGNHDGFTRQGPIVENPDRTNSSHFGTMDMLIPTYKGNQLLSVKEQGATAIGFKNGTTGNNYYYDANGNMIVDENKGITNIEYNHLNLPTEVVFNDDPNKKISYIYDATGGKHKKEVNDAGNVTTTMYAGNYIYENTGLGEELKFFSHPEGYVEPNGNIFDYVYQYKDHLGNIRLSYNEGNFESYINDGFYQEYDDWEYQGGAASGSIELEEGRLKVNVKENYNGVAFPLEGTFSIGDQVQINLELDKANTDRIRIMINELNANDVSVHWHTIDGNAQSGNISFTHTVDLGSKIRLKVDKSNTHSWEATHFFIDNVEAMSGDLEIVEENNYYPFGLRHKGYNNVVSSNANSVASKFKYNGKELEESLGLNLYEMDMRQYDPAIARWTSIDPVTHWSMSTYTAFDNNPVFFADPSGANSTAEWMEANGITQDDLITIYQAEDSSSDDSSSDCPPGDPNCSKKEDGTTQNQFEMSVDTENAVTPEMAALMITLVEADGPLPFGDGAAATIGLNILVAYAIAHGSVGIINSINESVLAAADANWVYAKQDKEINRILEKAGGPPGMTYMLTVNQATTTFDVRGNAITLQAGEVWKYGETTKGFGRYSDNTLKTMVPGGVTMKPLFFGNTVQIKVQEKIMIYGHFLATGSLPPGNKIFR